MRNCNTLPSLGLCSNPQPSYSNPTKCFQPLSSVHTRPWKLWLGSGAAVAAVAAAPKWPFVHKNRAKIPPGADIFQYGTVHIGSSYGLRCPKATRFLLFIYEMKVWKLNIGLDAWCVHGINFYFNYALWSLWEIGDFQENRRKPECTAPIGRPNGIHC